MRPANHNSTVSSVYSEIGFTSQNQRAWLSSPLLRTVLRLMSRRADVVDHDGLMWWTYEAYLSDDEVKKLHG
jgi:hypothetical protein